VDAWRGARFAEARVAWNRYHAGAKKSSQFFVKKYSRFPQFQKNRLTSICQVFGVKFEVNLNCQDSQIGLDFWVSSVWGDI
jgi:hypothetical protein